MTTPIDFSAYLRSLCNDYAQWWKAYAFMDEIDDSTWFEFELDSKTQEKPIKPGEKPTEKTQPVLAAIRDYAQEKILIVGSPGAGKSTLLARVMSDAAQQALKNLEFPIPVLVELKLYRESGIWGLLQTALENHNLYLEIPDIKRLIAEQRLLLLADGFNELPTEPTRAEFKNFCQRQMPVIVTTRDFVSDVGIERKLELQPLSSPKVKAFFQSRLPDQDQKQIQELCDRTRDFGQTPLMVWMIFSVFRENGEIPATRGEAYRAFTTLYAERAKAGIDLDESRGLLSKLAFSMMQAQKPTDFRLDISEVEAQNILGSEKTLKHLLRYHLLQAIGKPGNRQIRFCHQSLQEYYAAEALLAQLPSLSEEELKHHYLNLLKWTEPLLIVMSLLIDEAQALRVVKFGLDIDLMLGIELIKKLATTYHQQASSLIKELNINQKLKIFALRLTENILDEFVWHNIFLHQDALSEKHEKSLEELIQVLNSPNCSDQEFAILELSEKHTEVAIKLLEKFIKQEHWGELRALAVLRLAEIANIKSIQTIEESLRDNDWLVRLSAAQAVGLLKYEALAPKLIEMLEDHDYDVRGEAAYSLGKIGGERAIQCILDALSKADKNYEIEDKFTRFQIENRFVTEAVQGLAKESSFVHQRVINVLNNIGNKAALLHSLQDLQFLIESKPDPTRWISTVEVLAAIGSEPAIEVIIEVLDDENVDPNMLVTVVEIASRLQLQRAIPSLRKLIHKSLSSFVNESVADALANLHVEAELPRLIQLWELSGGQQYRSAISKLQEHCQFYNYELFQSPPVLEGRRHPHDGSASVYIESVKEITLMSDQPPIFNQYNPTIGVNYAAKDSNPKIIQNVHNTHQSSPEASLEAVVQIIRALEQKYTLVQDEQQALGIIDAEFKESKAKQLPQWQDLMNVKRLYNGGKKAALKVGEHFAEENVWGKGFLAFLEGLSEEVK